MEHLKFGEVTTEIHPETCEATELVEEVKNKTSDVWSEIQLAFADIMDKVKDCRSDTSHRPMHNRTVVRLKNRKIGKLAKKARRGKREVRK